MKYHKKQKIYQLSEEDIRPGEVYYYDSENNMNYWILETVEETKPDFFEVKKEDFDFCQTLGYIGENDVRSILEFLEYQYKIRYNSGHYRGYMITGNNSNLLEAKIVINDQELTSFLSITVYNLDERSKYILMKEVLSSMILFFKVGDEIYGPAPEIFIRNVENDK